MKYKKIQEALEKDGIFAPLVANRDVKVSVRGNEGLYASLTVRVAQAMESRGIEDKGCQRTLILAFAASLSKGTLDERPAQPAKEAPPAKAEVSPPPKSIASAAAPAKKVADEKSERVTVKPTQSLPGQVSPAKQALQQQNAQLAKFVERGEILKYQSAVAICQLLASIFQLAESDMWPGNEKRKSLLNELLESYEEISKSHVNLSVKQILRAQIENQITSR